MRERAGQDLKDLEKEMKLLMKADGEIKIKQGIKDPVFKELTMKKRNLDKQKVLENLVEDMLFEDEQEEEEQYVQPEPVSL